MCIRDRSAEGALPDLNRQVVEKLDVPLLTYSIDPEACTGCTICARKCPVSCIAGELRKPHVIDPEACIKCGKCAQVCRFGAVIVD